MTCKFFYIKIFCCIVILFAISCTYSSDKNAESNEVNAAESSNPKQSESDAPKNIELVIFKNDTVGEKRINGFGYNVYLNKQLYIHQPIIPAVPGDAGFKSEMDARNAGNLVLFKIKNNILPPALTVGELDSLDIDYHL